MSNAEYADDHETTIPEILDEYMSKEAAIEALMDYFRKADKHVVIAELAEWVYEDDGCAIVDIRGWIKYE